MTTCENQRKKINRSQFLELRDVSENMSMLCNGSSPWHDSSLGVMAFLSSCMTKQCMAHVVT